MEKPPSIPLLHRLLYRSYHQGASLRFWFGRRIRAAGIAAIASLIFAGCMTIGQPKQSVFQIFCLVASLISISILWTFFRKIQIRAQHYLPNHATVGETLRYGVKVENMTGKNIRGIRLRQSPLDPRPSLQEFSLIPEPGEEKRNLFDRIMIFYRWQWHIARKRVFDSPESEEISLEVGEKRHVSMTMTPHQRGVIAMDELRVLLPDPLGFFQRYRPVQAAAARLIVLPKRYQLPTLSMPGASAFRIGGEETSNTIGNSGEFLSLREYRPGDPMRQIHWKSWAHTGKPMVKELEDSYYPRYGLVLDTFPGSPDSHVFEEMISVAASFVVGLDRSESLLDLMFIADEAHTITAGRDMERTEKLLEVLAGVQAEPHARFRTLADTILQHRESMTSCLLVLNGWDEKRADFVKKLQKGGVVCVPVVISHEKTPESLQVHWIQADDIQRDLLRLPAELSAAIL